MISVNLESIFKTTFVVQDLLRGHAGGVEAVEKTRPGKASLDSHYLIFFPQVGVISNFMKPAHDQIHVRVDMSPEDMDSFIFCIASKKSSLRLSKEMADLATYCPERRPADKFDLPANYFIMSEVAEVASAMLDAKIVSMFRKFPDVIETIHFSDQFTGPKPTDDQQPLELPQGKQVCQLENLVCTIFETFSISGPDLCVQPADQGQDFGAGH